MLLVREEGSLAKKASKVALAPEVVVVLVSFGLTESLELEAAAEAGDAAAAAAARAEAAVERSMVVREGRRNRNDRCLGRGLVVCVIMCVWLCGGIGTGRCDMGGGIN